MLVQVLKILIFLISLTPLAACAAVNSKSIDKLPSPTIPPYLTSSPGASFPEPIKTVTVILPTVSQGQSIQIPSQDPSSSPSPSGQTLAGMWVAGLKMFDPNTGWAVYSAPFIHPENSIILRTTDATKTWTGVTPPISESNSNIRAAHFINPDTAVVASSRSYLPQSYAVDVITWRTTNGGLSWQVGETLKFSDAPGFLPGELTFIDQVNGWMLGESDAGMNNMRLHLYETRDGGAHWGKLYNSAEHLSDPDTLWIKGYYPYSKRLTFITNKAGFFSDGRLFSSLDGGMSWKFRSLDPPNDFPEIECNVGKCNYLDLVSAPVFSSSQDGLLIRRVYANSEDVLDVLVYYPNTLNRLPLPTAQYLYFTYDGGQTWLPRSSPAKIGTVYFMNAHTGWLLGKSDPDPSIPTTLYQSIDGGETWNPISANCPLPLGSEIQFVDEDTGFAFYPFPVSDYYRDFDTRGRENGQQPLLFSTHDGGRTWDLTEATFPSATSSLTFTPSPSLTTTPTPAIQIDLSRFDPDVWPAIDVSHNPPLIAKSDEIVKLDFDTICLYVMQATGLNCNFNQTLFYTYGEDNDFSSLSLNFEIQNDSSDWTATLPATDEVGQPLRYYLQVNDPQVGLDVRYPTEGTIDLFAVTEFIPVDLPAQKPIEHSESALFAPWGGGPEAVGLRKRDGYPAREGPLAMDVSEDGRMALLDFVNERVLIYDSRDQSYSSLPLPFTLKNQGDVQFDQYGQVAVLDPVGETIEQSTATVPQLYRLFPDGRVNAVAPVFASIPAWLTKDLEVVDLDYSKMVVPFSPSGEVNTREAQRHKQPAELLAKYMTDTVHEVRLADTQDGIAFSVRSVSPLGAITYWGKTPQGYIVVFEGDQIRAIWFDASGAVLQDITLPRDDYSEVNSKGRMAVDSQGALYVMESTVRGIEVRYVKAP